MAYSGRPVHLVSKAEFVKIVGVPKEEVEAALFDGWLEPAWKSSHSEWSFDRDLALHLWQKHKGPIQSKSSRDEPIDELRELDNSLARSKKQGININL